MLRKALKSNQLKIGIIKMGKTKKDVALITKNSETN